jgi:endonuclease YncB( thermonuclease family)
LSIRSLSQSIRLEGNLTVSPVVSRVPDDLEGIDAELSPQIVRRASVLSIGDGDTIRVLQGQQRITIRLACIDAPEMAQAPYGANARSYLQTRLRLGSSVTLRPQAVERYGRTVAEVIGEVNLNLAMVGDGQAFAYRQYLRGCDTTEYLNAEFRASRRRYGVWQVEGASHAPGTSAGASAEP